MTLRTNAGAACLAAALLAPALAPAALAGDELPPFDFSDAFYFQNGYDPARIIGRPTGNPPNAVIDNRENGPEFNNVRILATNGAYDDSGKPIFFTVTGFPSLASFLPGPAGQEALEVAERYQVYEFPRAANAPLALFPIRQQLIADLRNGYFSNDPLGVWRVNHVRYTPAATGTPAGQQALAQLAARNGRDLDGTPLIRTVSEVESLHAQGFVTIAIPPMDGSAGLRWFFCPVIKDPRDGAIAPDAFLAAPVAIPAAQEFIQLFECLRATGDDCETRVCWANCDNSSGSPVLNVADFSCFLSRYAAGEAYANCDQSAAPPVLNVADFSCFLQKYAAGCP